MEVAAAGLLLVTPTGDWVREGSREFLAVLGDPDPDYDAAMFAVRNFGFVAIRRLFRITYLADRWRHETVTAARDAATRIAELCLKCG
jgi:hypothetical protein